MHFILLKIPYLYLNANANVYVNAEIYKWIEFLFNREILKIIDFKIQENYSNFFISSNIYGQQLFWK